MSDMSRLGPRSPAASDHERHDALLVAQFVAGDPLDPAQQAEARRLVVGCGACAALAADLPAVSRAVAQESVPPRRRDFRLSPEQAEQLRGNALRRFLGRISLPGSRAFQPAAAGVLSIGLLFVIAGYAWPDGGTISVQAEPNFIDWSSPTAASLEPAEEAALAPAPSALAPAPIVEPDTDAAASLDGAERLMESEFADSLAESQAGISEEKMQKSLETTEGARSPEDAEELLLLEAQELGVAADAIEQSADDEAANQSARSVVPGGTVKDEAGAGEGESTVTGAGNVFVDEGSPEDLLILLGLVLALGGGGLLLLGWLARRARDPLAP